MLMTKYSSHGDFSTTNRIFISNKHSGFTLIELLVALALNVVILLALISVFSSNIAHVNQATNSDTLNQQLEAAMQSMANDIRRAGYWGNAISDIGNGQNNNPFMAAGADVSVPASNCILFSYDYDSNGAAPSISASYDDERYGYRLNGQTLQSRPPGASYDCNAAGSAWENVTNPGIVSITSLSFTLNSTTVPVGGASKTLLLRSVDISMTGQLVGNAAVTKTLTQHVRLLNDKYVP